jgi:hypothetical protein
MAAQEHFTDGSYVSILVPSVIIQPNRDLQQYAELHLPLIGKDWVGVCV